MPGAGTLGKAARSGTGTGSQDRSSEIPGVHSSPLLTLSGPAAVAGSAPLAAGGRTLPFLGSSYHTPVPSVSDNLI